MDLATLEVNGVQVGAAAILHDTMDRRTGLGFGDGSFQSYAWQVDGDLAGIGHAYPNRPADNVTFSYAHDRAGRVVTEQIGHAAYDYEAAPGTCAYGAATAINTYPTVCGVTLSYGAQTNPQALRPDGAIHGDNAWRYRYDGHGRLIDAYWTIASGPPLVQRWVRHSLDALGERWYSVHHEGTGPQTAFWSFSDGLRPEVVSEPSRGRPTGGGTPWVTGPTRTSVLGPLPDERLIHAERSGSTTTVFYPHTDIRGSTVALSQGGMAVQTFSYDEFGRSGPSGVSGYPWRYTGQRLDPWTGLYHYKAREYAPNLGRFLQPDPAGFVDGPNLYAYVGNSPWNATDPSGMQERSAGLTNGFWDGEDEREIRQDGVRSIVERGDRGIARFLSGGRSQSLGEYASDVTEELVGAFQEGAIGGRIGRLGRLGQIGRVSASAGILGRSYGSLGTVVRNPGIQFTGFYRNSQGELHGLQRIIGRDMHMRTVHQTLDRPAVVLSQSGGRHAYLSREAVVILNRRGELVTAYPRRDFGSDILGVLRDAGH